MDTIDFAVYLRKLTLDLFSSYSVETDKISLKLDLEEINLDMDVAIPLGIIVNELVSNSLKYAFPSGKEYEIRISLHRAEDSTSKPGNSGKDRGCKIENDFNYTLTVADNVKGIPEEVDFQNPESLGLQLVNILVEQIDGCIELKRDHGTEFTIRFNNPGNE